jgi:sterol desaturase/sphingolipid hydroxylase (fatty acid hydroxylase superfamily)
MSDVTFRRDKRGDWKPDERIELAPVLVWPVQPVRFLKWLFGFPGYLWPWNLLFAGIALATWLWLTPDMATMREVEAGWIAFILARNAVLITLYVGAWHLWLYVIRGQGDRYKYTTRPLARGSRTFLFGNQVWDNVFWTLASGVPIWTAYEVLTLWAYANDWLPFASWESDPVWFVAVFLLIPVFRDFHFYLIHRLIHWKPLYDRVHSLHHRNVNIGPWSGMSMHPVEHALYLCGVFIHWIVPSHPLHAIFHLQHLAFSPAQGHAGFDRIEGPGNVALGRGNYYHYLHHKHFECNYGGEGICPFDKWFGTLHDGSEEAEARMNQRFMERARRQQAKQAARERRRAV